MFMQTKILFYGGKHNTMIHIYIQLLYIGTKIKHINIIENEDIITFISNSIM